MSPTTPQPPASPILHQPPRASAPGLSTVQAPATGGQDLLQRNLLTLALRNQALARTLAAAQPSPDLWLTPTSEDALGGGLKPVDALAEILGESTSDAGATQLASRFEPLTEAAELCRTIDLTTVATVVCLGFGLGHHVRWLSEKLGVHGLVVVYEPDVDLLRAVMERIDCTPWLVRANVVILTDENDSAAIAEGTAGFETMLALGSKLLVHPPSAGRLGERAKVFAENFTSVLKAARTHIVTSLVQTEITLRNLLQNLDHFVAAPGIDELAGRCAGKPAIVVSAGPSLARNIDLLAQPGVREKFVIVAAQTVLKPLLARGIKPHFVTALDHHEISRRFYEGLTPQDVEGVTLIAEPKANAAILAAFPGLIRCVGDKVLERLLEGGPMGPALAGEKGKLPPGATVAHLAYYVARHLACDPVILVGQDLGFTDNQYYAAGAAIHNVWAGELSEFNTLEMLEWERIARTKATLRRVSDQRGRPIYTDEQMHTYLVQFERDFARDEAQGLSIIDATEGGVAKRHTRPLTLAEALETFAKGTIPTPDPLQPTLQGRSLDARTAAALQSRLRTIRADVLAIRNHAKGSATLLRKMLVAGGDQRQISSLITKVYQHRDGVQKLETANWLVHFLNQCGTFRRLRADRAIALAENLSPLETQTRQIERDLANVEWLADAADQTTKLLDDASLALSGGPKVTRDDAGDDSTIEGKEAEAKRRRVAAVVLADPTRNSLGFPRSLAHELEPGTSILRATLLGLAQAQELDGLVILTPNVNATRALAGKLPAGIAIHFAPIDEAALRRHQQSVRSARAWSRDSWRGGVASLTIFDEVCPAGPVAAALREHLYDAACLVGADWSFIDPSLTDAVVSRYREAPTRQRFTFTQAAPGIAPALLDLTLLDELAGATHDFATVAGLMRYIPVAPQADPIARPTCVQVPVSLRDARSRLTLDSDEAATRAAATIASLGPPWHEMSAADLLDRTDPAAALLATPAFPELLDIELVANNGAQLNLESAHALARELRPHPHTAVTLRSSAPASPVGVREPHPQLLDIISALQQAGITALHVRAHITWPRDLLLTLASRVQVLSIEVDDPSASLAALDDLRARRAAAQAADESFARVVPRLTRRDETLDAIEGFYDACLMAFGACAIDPDLAAGAADRIRPLPLPTLAQDRAGRTTLHIAVDGNVRSSGGLTSGPSLGHLGGPSSLRDLWLRRAAAQTVEPKPVPARAL